MARAALTRLLLAPLTILFVVTVAFVVMRAAPGGPFDQDRPLDPAALANLKRIYNLDAPLWRQYLDYLSGLLRGDFGPSFSFRDIGVGEILRRAFPVSLT